MKLKKTLQLKKPKIVEKIEKSKKKGAYFTIIKNGKNIYLTQYEARVMEEIIKKGGRAASIEEIADSIKKRQGWVSVKIIKRTIEKLEKAGYLKKTSEKNKEVVVSINFNNSLKGERRKLYEKLLEEQKFQKAMKLKYGTIEEKKRILKEYGLI